MDIFLTRVPHHYHANHDCVVYECAILNYGVVEGKRVIVRVFQLQAEIGK